MYGDFIITSLGSKRSLSYEELFLRSRHAQLKQKQKNQRRKQGSDGASDSQPPCFVHLFALTQQHLLRGLHY